jgi:hypothetical protein
MRLRTRCEILKLENVDLEELSNALLRKGFLRARVWKNPRRYTKTRHLELPLEKYLEPEERGYFTRDNHFWLISELDSIHGKLNTVWKNASKNLSDDRNRRIITPSLLMRLIGRRPERRTLFSYLYQEIMAMRAWFHELERIRKEQKLSERSPIDQWRENPSYDDWIRLGIDLYLDEQILEIDEKSKEVGDADAEEFNCFIRKQSHDNSRWEGVYEDKLAAFPSCAREALSFSYDSMVDSEAAYEENDLDTLPMKLFISLCDFFRPPYLDAVKTKLEIADDFQAIALLERLSTTKKAIIDKLRFNKNKSLQKIFKKVVREKINFVRCLFPERKLSSIGKQDLVSKIGRRGITADDFKTAVTSLRDTLEKLEQIVLQTS